MNVLFLRQNAQGMKKRSSRERRFVKVVGNKYFIASLLFLVWFVFFDENSYLSHQQNKEQLEELIQQKEYYLERIATDKQKLNDLKSGKDHLEKFAREEYFMSKPDEDIFIVIEKEWPPEKIAQFL